MSFTLTILIVTVVVTMTAWNNPALQYKLMMNPYSVLRHRQYYRHITSGFVHANWIHLGFNMFTFYFFGSQKYWWLNNSEKHFHKIIPFTKKNKYIYGKKGKRQPAGPGPGPGPWTHGPKGAWAHGLMGPMGPMGPLGPMGSIHSFIHSFIQ